MSIQRNLLFLLILSYSASLMFIEWQGSQAAVRPFFTDIKGEVFFYAVNTTLSAFLLWSIGVLFAVCLLCVDRMAERREYFFCLSQVIMFTYLGIDERFMIHEAVGEWLGRNDAYLLLGLGLIECGLLIWLGDIAHRSQKIRRYLLTASILFLCMVVIDAKFPSNLVLRLSFEDLSKVWAEWFLVLFAWEIISGKINDLIALKQSNSHRIQRLTE